MREPLAASHEAAEAWGDMTNRRVDPRYKMWIPVACPDLHGGAAMAHDISDSGLRMVTRRMPGVGDRLRLSFAVPPDGGERYEAEATVVRADVNELDPGGLWPYGVAVRFEEPIAQLASALGDKDSDI